jgi:hypothetical protein
LDHELQVKQVLDAGRRVPPLVDVFVEGAEPGVVAALKAANGLVDLVD